MSLRVFCYLLMKELLSSDQVSPSRKIYFVSAWIQEKGGGVNLNANKMELRGYCHFYFLFQKTLKN